MTSVGVAEALEAALYSLLLMPGVDARVDVPTDVVGSRRALLVAQLPVCGPRHFVDADHTAGRSSRGHVDSVADSAIATHPVTANYSVIRVADVLLVPTHPEVEWRRADQPDTGRLKPP